MESDDALDEECALYEIAGLDFEEACADDGRARAALEGCLPELMAFAVKPTFVGDPVVVSKLMCCFLEYPNEISAAVKVRMRDAVAGISDGRFAEEAPELASLVPAYDRAVTYQVLATLLMRHGCAVSPAEQSVLMDGVLNCEEHAMALDETAAKYFERDESGHGRRAARVRALHALWAQLKAYDIRGGVAQELESKGLLQAIVEKQQGSKLVTLSDSDCPALKPECPVCGAEEGQACSKPDPSHVGLGIELGNQVHAARLA